MGSVTIGTAGALEGTAGGEEEVDEEGEGRGSSTGRNVIRGDGKLTCRREVAAFCPVCLGKRERSLQRRGDFLCSGMALKVTTVRVFHISNISQLFKGRDKQHLGWSRHSINKSSFFFCGGQYPRHNNIFWENTASNSVTKKRHEQ